METDSTFWTPPQSSGVSPTPKEKWEWTPKRVQNILLTLGAVLCSFAALLFTAYAWGQLGLGGRVAVMSGVTTLAGVGGFVTHRRGLAATAEALTAFGLSLALIDAAAVYALNLLGLGALPLWLYSAGVLSALTFLAIAYRVAVPLRSTSWFALVVGQLPLPLVVFGGGALPAAVITAGLAAQVVVLALLARHALADHALRGVALGSAMITYSFTALSVFLLVAVSAEGYRWEQSGLPLEILAATALVVGYVLNEMHRKALAVGTTIAGTAVAIDAFVLAGNVVRGDMFPVAAAVIGLGLIAMALPLRSITGNKVLTVGVLALSIGALNVLGSALLSFVTPFSQLLDAWSLDASEAFTVRIASSPFPQTSIATFGVVLIGMTATLLAGVVAGRQSIARPIAVGLGVLVVSLVPTTFSFTFAPALAWYFVIGTALALRSWFALDKGAVRDVAALSSSLVLLQALGLSTGLDVATALIFCLISLLAGGVAYADRGTLSTLAPLASLTAAVALGSVVSILGGEYSLVGTALVFSGLFVTVLARRFDAKAELNVTVVAGLLVAAYGFSVSMNDAGAASASLLTIVGASAILALQPRDRAFKWVSAGTLLVFIWLRAAIASIDTLEAYSLPLALLVLAAGFSVGRRAERPSSWTMFGSGLLSAFLPTLLVLLLDDGIVRHICLGLAALVVVILGARHRMQAPLVIGGLVLLTEAIMQFGPYAQVLPRWVGVGTAGLVLLFLGASWERRYRNLQGLRSRYEALQ